MRKKLLLFSRKLFAVYAGLVFMLLLISCYPFVYVLPFTKLKFRVPTYFAIVRWLMDIFAILTLCKLTIKGKRNVRKKKPYIIIGNHRSLFDIVFSTPFFPRYNFTIAKIELTKIPVFSVYYTLGSILVDRAKRDSKMESYNKMKEVLKQGYCMIIFPEGTRNKTSRPLLPFKNGAFSLSLETGVPILPIVMLNTEKIMPPNRFLYFKPHKAKMYILPEIKPDGFDNVESYKKHCYDIMERVYVKRKK